MSLNELRSTSYLLPVSWLSSFLDSASWDRRGILSKNSQISCFSGDKPTYAQIAEWRKILNRLASFLKSVDYLVLEMLRRLVVTATKHLLDHLVSAYNVTEEEEVKVNFTIIDNSLYMRHWCDLLPHNDDF